MATADKVLSILGLFTIEQPQWTVDAIASTLHLSGSTAYQYVRSLVDAGLLVAGKGGLYTIGPAVIELDRLMRRFDPLIHAAQAPLRDLVETVDGAAIGLLCRIYRLRVMCVDQYVRHPPVAAISYERGRPMPLTRGAASKVILANLNGRQLRRFFDTHRDEAATSGLGSDWDGFRRAVRQFRKAGALVTTGELDEGMTGISAPVFGGDGDVVGSIGLVIPAVSGENAATLDRFRAAVTSAGTRLTGLIGAT